MQADEASAYNDTNHREATDLGAAAGSAPESPAVAIVSNHCGWTDILVHMARSFPSFVARADTTQLTMIGLIRCSLAACTPSVLFCSCAAADNGWPRRVPAGCLLVRDVVVQLCSGRPCSASTAARWLRAALLCTSAD